jgi:hypothetical protein
MCHNRRQGLEYSPKLEALYPRTGRVDKARVWWAPFRPGYIKRRIAMVRSFHTIPREYALVHKEVEGSGPGPLLSVVGIHELEHM